MRRRTVLVILGLFFLPLPVLALSSGGVGGYPANPDPNIRFSQSWFIYNLGPGQTKNDTLIVANTSDEEHTVKLYAVDSVPSNQGNFALESEADPREGVGAWIQLSEEIITLPPGETRRIDFTMTIPEVVDVGEHSGGIIIQKVQPGDVAGTGAAVVTRVGVRVYNTVPGEIIKKIELGDFTVVKNKPENKDPFYDIALTAYNQGNITIQANSVLNITGWGKREYVSKSETSAGLVINIGQMADFTTNEANAREWQLLRDQKVITRWEWPEPKFGRYSFRVSVEYEATGGAVESLETPTVTIWVMPWVELAVLGGILLLIIILIALKKTVFGIRRWQQYKVKKGEDIFDIANQAGIKWEKLVKVNKLNNPKVRANQIILAPPSLAGLPAGQAGKSVSVRDEVSADLPSEPVVAAKKVKSGGKKAVESANKFPELDDFAKATMDTGKSISEISRPPRRLSAKWWVVSIVVLLAAGAVWYFVSFQGVSEAEPQPAAVDPNQPAPVLSPADVFVGVYEPLLPTSTASSTRLLLERLQQLGFRATVTAEIIDQAAIEQEQTTLVFSDANRAKVEILAGELFLTNTYQQGLNDSLANFDAMITSWNYENIDWGELSTQIEAIFSVEADQAVIRVLNAGAAPGTAGQVAKLLQSKGFALTTAANAPALVSQAVTISYPRNLKGLAQDIDLILQQDGYATSTLVFAPGRAVDIVVTLGQGNKSNQ